MDLAAGVYLFEAPSSPVAPYSPPPYSMYNVHVHLYTVYGTYSHREGGEELTREKVTGEIVHIAGSKIPT
jgi:hypothetical protein